MPIYGARADWQTSRFYLLSHFPQLFFLFLTLITFCLCRLRRSLLVSEHEEELAEITALCRKEMRLLVAVKSGALVSDWPYPLTPTPTPHLTRPYIPDPHSPTPSFQPVAPIHTSSCPYPLALSSQPLNPNPCLYPLTPPPRSPCPSLPVLLPSHPQPKPRTQTDQHHLLDTVAGVIHNKNLFSLEKVFHGNYKP